MTKSKRDSFSIASWLPFFTSLLLDSQKSNLLHRDFIFELKVPKEASHGTSTKPGSFDNMLLFLLFFLLCLKS